MFDPRIYRAALLPAVAALVAADVLVRADPEPAPRAGYDPHLRRRPRRRGRPARSSSLAPDRPPGSAGDDASPTSSANGSRGSRAARSPCRRRLQLRWRGRDAAERDPDAAGESDRTILLIGPSRLRRGPRRRDERGGDRDPARHRRRSRPLAAHEDVRPRLHRRRRTAPGRAAS